jgi:REP element-mobilizing transposase RayT
MGRPLRIEYPGALYHITSRGNERRDIFRDDGDRKKFCEILADYHSRFNVYIHSFVLMTNHYHLILETPQGNLLKVMHGINGKYTGYFNRKYGRNGHLFQGRYKGILVDRDAYLLQLSRYVHLNPVKAGIIDKPERYVWSSYPGFIGHGEKYEWVEYPWILGQFGPDEHKSMQEYKRFVDAGLEEAQNNLFSDAHGQVILGDETFVEKTRSLLAGRQLSREIVNLNNLQIVPQPEKIIAAVADKYGVEEKKITESGAKGNIARKVAMYLVHQYSGIGNSEIGKLFGGIHYTAVSKTVARLKQEISDGKDYELAGLLDRIKSNVKT